MLEPIYVFQENMEQVYRVSVSCQTQLCFKLMLYFILQPNPPVWNTQIIIYNMILGDWIKLKKEMKCSIFLVFKSKINCNELSILRDCISCFYYHFFPFFFGQKYNMKIIYHVDKETTIRSKWLCKKSWKMDETQMKNGVKPTKNWNPKQSPWQHVTNIVRCIFMTWCYISLRQY